MDSKSFVSDYFAGWHGWLSAHAVHTTGALLQAQARLGVPGCNVEIGVFLGKYLGALIAMSPSRAAFGFDIWLYNNKEDAARNLSRLPGQPQYTLVQANTADLTTERFAELIEQQPIAFASIDGAHTRLGVKCDIALILPALAKGGIIAIDDFLSAGCMGVTEGTIEALHTTDLEPICFSQNKLYLTTHTWAEIYNYHLQVWLDRGEGKEFYKRDRPPDQTVLAGKSLITF